MGCPWPIHKMDIWTEDVNIVEVLPDALHQHSIISCQRVRQISLIIIISIGNQRTVRENIQAIGRLGMKINAIATLTKSNIGYGVVQSSPLENFIFDNCIDQKLQHINKYSNLYFSSICARIVSNIIWDSGPYLCLYM